MDVTLEAHQDNTDLSAAPAVSVGGILSRMQQEVVAAEPRLDGLKGDP